MAVEKKYHPYRQPFWKKTNQDFEFFLKLVYKSIHIVYLFQNCNFSRCQSEDQFENWYKSKIKRTYEVNFILLIDLKTKNIHSHDLTRKEKKIPSTISNHSNPHCRKQTANVLPRRVL